MVFSKLVSLTAVIKLVGPYSSSPLTYLHFGFDSVVRLTSGENLVFLATALHFLSAFIDFQIFLFHMFIFSL